MSENQPAYTTRHLGVIPDGGRRWARKNEVPLEQAYMFSFERVRDLIVMAHEIGFGEITVYAMSRANTQRVSDELQAVYSGLVEFSKLVARLADDGYVSTIHVHGDLTLFPKTVRSLFEELVGTRGPMNGSQVNLLLGYDAWDELTAARTRNPTQITLEDLWVTTRVDAVIRSGGAPLLSGFLPLQTQYAPILFTQGMFNDLTDQDFRELLQRAWEFKHLMGR
jgi:undecaprenyl diphosphate synthase